MWASARVYENTLASPEGDNSALPRERLWSPRRPSEPTHRRQRQSLRAELRRLDRSLKPATNQLNEVTSGVDSLARGMEGGSKEEEGVPVELHPVQGHGAADLHAQTAAPKTEWEGKDHTQRY